MRIGSCLHPHLPRCVAALGAAAATVAVCVGLVFAAPANEDSGIGPPPPLPPGQAPPLPKAGPPGGAALTRSGRLSHGADQHRSSRPASPLTPATVALGEKLFFDSRLSGDGTVACATCHDPARAFTDGRPGLGRHPRPRRSAQRANHLERALQQDAVLGRPGRYARATGGAADHESLRDGLGQRSAMPSPKSPATRTTRSNSCRPSAVA